ncbi:hydroxypyruvate isomerase family protein [Flavobacteriaceae bacterium M23B6Z8]
MKRRNFITNSLLGSAALGLMPSKAFSSSSDTMAKHRFNLKYAPHDGMFKAHAGADILDQLKFIADEGFTAFEDNEMKNRSPETQKAIGKLMEELGLEMGVFVGHKIYWNQPNLAGGNEAMRAEFLKDIQDAVEVAKRVRAKWITVVPGHLDMRKEMGYQTANVIESLKQAAGILEPHKLVMVLEPLNFYNHPGLFLTKSAQAYEICKAVNSPSCKILFDIYHQQIQEGNLLPNIETCWDEIAYFQIGDNPGRNEPGTGEINYKNIFKFIHAKGYQGILGMEHGNSMPEEKGEQAVIDAYKKADNFL